jgi:hypothetical protein
LARCLPWTGSNRSRGTWLKEEIRIALRRFAEQKRRDVLNVAVAELAALESGTAETKKAATTPKKKRGPKVVTRPLLRTIGGREGAAFSEFGLRRKLPCSLKSARCSRISVWWTRNWHQGKQYVPLLHEACCQS